MFVNNFLQYVVKDRSSDHLTTNNIDYLLIELQNTSITLCCMYCPPNIKLNHVVAQLKHIKAISSPHTIFVAGGDYNINLLDDIPDISIEFLNSMLTIGLFSVINLPTRVTDTSSTLINNFLCDVSLLPVHSSVIKTDLSDHNLIELSLTTASDIKTITKRSFTNKNKIKFTNRLKSAKWDPLYLITDASHAFNYFIKKIKRIIASHFRSKLYLGNQRKIPG